MVQPTGLEPVTSSFAGRRSNPTELRLHIVSSTGNIAKTDKKASLSHDNYREYLYRSDTEGQSMEYFFFDFFAISHEEFPEKVALSLL